MSAWYGALDERFLLGSLDLVTLRTAVAAELPQEEKAPIEEEDGIRKVLA
jgi:hypothetical protein